MVATWPFGILLELVSTASGTVGKQLIRFSEIYKSKGLKARSRVALKLGLFLNTAFGPIVDTFAYAFAPASLLAPIGGLDIVWNMLSAPFTLGEKLTCRRWCSIVLIFAGTFGSVFPADHQEIKYTNAVLHVLLPRTRVLVYAVCFLLWLALNFLVLMRRPVGSVARGFSLGATSGTIAGNMFCVKAAVELVKTSILDGSLAVWTDWISWLVVFSAFFFALSSVVFMTKGLQEYQALFMVTLYEGSMIVSNALSACIVLGELDQKATWIQAWYSFCILTIVFALALLLSGEEFSKQLTENSEIDNSELAGCAENGLPSQSVDIRRYVTR